MKIHLISDGHFEFGDMPSTYTPPECDVVLLAGDMSPTLWGVEWAKITFENTPVLYVMGNHELYGGVPYDTWVETLKATAAGSNVTVLENDAVVIDGVRFMGAALWSDFNLYNNQFADRYHAERFMNDYVHIRASNGMKLTGNDTANLHYDTVKFFEEQFQLDPEIKTVVMTHHAPSEMSCLKEYKGHNLTPAYASRLEWMMLKYNPALWVHGHMHNSSDYMVGDTRVVTNPRGYVGHHGFNKNFNPELVIEI